MTTILLIQMLKKKDIRISVTFATITHKVVTPETCIIFHRPGLFFVTVPFKADRETERERERERGRGRGSIAKKKKRGNGNAACENKR